jgi:hypothetical protein
MSSSSWCPPSAPATSSSWTISAVTRQGRAPLDPRRRRQAVLSAALLARSQSHRTGLLEQVFAKLKTLLRKLDPRTIEATWRGIGDLLDRFTPQECANYLTNAGYASA